MSKKLLFNNSITTIETDIGGFASGTGNLDANTNFTHTVTYIDIDKYSDKKIVTGTKGWAMIVYYDANKNVLTTYNFSYETDTYQINGIRNHKPNTTNAVYIRISINKVTTFTLTNA